MKTEKGEIILAHVGIGIIKSDNTQTLVNAIDEKEILIKAFSDVAKEFNSRDWITDGRGSYAYNDEGYRKEVSYLFDAFKKIESEVWKNIKSKTFEYKNRIEKPFVQQIEKMEAEKRELLEGLNGIESLCDNQNPSHEDIWRISESLIQKMKQ